MRFMESKKFAVGLLVCLSMQACRTRNTFTESSQIASASQPDSEDDYIKGFNQKVQALTSVEEQAIMESTVGSVFTDFKRKLDNGEIAALGIPVEKVKEAIQKYPKEYEKMMNSKVTIAELARANKIRSVREVKLFSSAWQSDLDAFPTEDMWPARVTVSTAITKTPVIDTSSHAGDRGLNLVGVPGAFRLLTCGVAVVGGLVTAPLFAKTTAEIVQYPDQTPRGFVGDLRPFFATVMGALSAQSAIIAKLTCL